MGDLRGSLARLFVALEHKVCAGIDLGGTKIAIVLGTETGAILAHAKIETRADDGPQSAFTRTLETIHKLSADCGAKCSAIGLGVPGLADPRSGVIQFLPNLPDNWNRFPAGAFLAQQYGVPAYVLNDARLAALGEFHFGSGAHSSNMLVVTLGTGVGGGLILEGKLRMGECAAAGEVGHQTILPDGPECGCGSRGCLETLINGRQLTQAGASLAREGKAPRLLELVSGELDRITPREMAQAVALGDSAVAAAIEQSARYLGIGIANAVSITAVSDVVLCGGVAALGDLILLPVKEEVAKRVRMFPAADRVSIRQSDLGERVGALGALALAFHPLFTQEKASVA
jgi:glucokinase